MTVPTLTGRDRAILRAVAGGRAQLTISSEPDLTIDGLHCCDQHAAHGLCRAGLICPAALGRSGAQVPAQLTAAGAAALGDVTGGAR